MHAVHEVMSVRANTHISRSYEVMSVRANTHISRSYEVMSVRANTHMQAGVWKGCVLYTGSW